MTEAVSDMLTREQSELLAYMLENLPVNEEASITSGSLKGGRLAPITTASSMLEGDDEINFVFNLPSSGGHIFLTVTDGEEAEIKKIVATLEDYELSGTKLAVGNYVAIPSEYLERNGRVGIVLLKMETIGVLRDFPEFLKLGEVQYHFVLVVFISHEEYEFKKKFGHDALMDRFSKEDKDLISISA